jgi:hypothetical protein
MMHDLSVLFPGCELSWDVNPLLCNTWLDASFRVCTTRSLAGNLTEHHGFTAVANEPVIVAYNSSLPRIRIVLAERTREDGTRFRPAFTKQPRAIYVNPADGYTGRWIILR